MIPLALVIAVADARAATPGRGRMVAIHTSYSAWNGATRALRIAYPADSDWQAAGRRLPLVIAVHGAAGEARCDESFGRAPLRFGFVVACLEGQGTATTSFSYGAPGQIRDQLRVPDLVQARLPNLPLDRSRVIIAGSSMGGLEALLAADADPSAFAVVVALDAPVDLAAHYRRVAPPTGANLKSRAMVAECGGSPAVAFACFHERSPLRQLDRFGPSSVPLVMWWSRYDRIAGSPDGSPAYIAALQERYPAHPIYARVGVWQHGRGLWSHGRLWLRDALALARANPQRGASEFG
jgi:poly(3-hydroxybutyrate) depolymerase